MTEIIIYENTSEEAKERIKSQLNEGTLRLPIYPYPKMLLGLPDGSEITILKVLPLAQGLNTPCAIALVKPSTSFMS